MKRAVLVVGILSLLISINAYILGKALYYRDLYYNDPRVQIVEHSKTVYGRFDPDRSQAYTCTVQNIVDSVGMICKSADGNIAVNCTVGGDPDQYFC